MIKISNKFHQEAQTIFLLFIIFFGGGGEGVGGVIFAGRALKVGQIFSCSMSILSIHNNRRLETVSMPK